MLFRTSRHVFFVPLRSRSRYSGFSFRFRLFVCLFVWSSIFFLSRENLNTIITRHTIFFCFDTCGSISGRESGFRCLETSSVNFAFSVSNFQRIAFKLQVIPQPASTFSNSASFEFHSRRYNSKTLKKGSRKLRSFNSVINFYFDFFFLI